MPKYLTVGKIGLIEKDYLEGDHLVSWKLHILMAEKRLKIIDVARSADLAWETVSAIYRGKAKAVSLETLDKLCRALGCHPGDLFEYR